MSELKTDRQLSFLDHVDELRKCFLRVASVVLFTTCVLYLFIDSILGFVLKPVGHVVFTAPADAFIARIVLTLYVAIFVVFPYVLYEIWQFVKSGLKKSEERAVIIFGPLAVICFFMGGIFGYVVIVPISVQFLLGYSSANLVPMITIKNYISFIGTLVLAFGVIFELPLIMMFLTRIGIATPAFLTQKRRHAIIILLILSALITPPDIITLLLMALPLIILYECGVVFSRLVYIKHYSKQGS